MELHAGQVLVLLELGSHVLGHLGPGGLLELVDVLPALAAETQDLELELGFYHVWVLIRWGSIIYLCI